MSAVFLKEEVYELLFSALCLKFYSFQETPIGENRDDKLNSGTSKSTTEGINLAHCTSLIILSISTLQTQSYETRRRGKALQTLMRWRVWYSDSGLILRERRREEGRF